MSYFLPLYANFQLSISQNMPVQLVPCFVGVHHIVCENGSPFIRPFNVKATKKGKKKLFHGCNRPKLSVLADFFFQFFQNLVKSAIFGPKSKHFSWKFLKISQNILILKFFCKKCQIFLNEILAFLGSFLLPQIKNNKKTTKWPTLLGRPICP